MTLNWGICCCGLISQDFTSAFREYPDFRNKIVAVAARNESSAKLFAEKFQIKSYFGSYEKLALFEEVDIIYVGSIDKEHCSLTKLFLNNGKHVLVEKTMGRNVSETKEMIELAKEKKLFLMEGVWSRCFPIYKKIRDLTISGSIGSVLHVNADIQCELKSENVWSKELEGSGMKALGIYALQFALWVFQGKKLENWRGHIKRTENGVDMCGNILLEFEDNRTAFLSYHMGVTGNSSASIFGEKDSIIIPKHFWAPETIIVNGKEDHSMGTKRNNLDFKYNFGSSFGFVHEIRHVADCIEKGLTESDIHPLHDTYRMAEIMETLLTQ